MVRLEAAAREPGASSFLQKPHCQSTRASGPSKPASYRNEDYLGIGYPDISWHGVEAWNTDWADYSHTLAFLIAGAYAYTEQKEESEEKSKSDTDRKTFIYAALNMHWEPHNFEIPEISIGMQWYLAANTGANPPDDSYTPDKEPLLADQDTVLLAPRSVVILVGK